MKLRSSASKSSEEVLLKNLRRPNKEVVYVKIYELQYPRMLTRKLLKQVQWSIVRMRRGKKLPPKSFNISYEYTTEAGKVEVTVPVITGGPWRFDAIPGVKIPEVTPLTPYHCTPLHSRRPSSRSCSRLPSSNLSKIPSLATSQVPKL